MNAKNRRDFIKKSLLGSLVFTAAGITGCSGSKEKRLLLSFMEMKGKGPGWGMGVVIQTPNGGIYLYDAGSNYPKGEFDAGKDMIAPFLRERNIRKIDGVLISHSHNDHFGGFEYLMRNFEVGHLWDSGYSFTSDPEYDTIYKPEYIAKGGQYTKVFQGDVLNWDKDLKIEVLSPPSSYLTISNDKFTDPVDHQYPNLNTIVLRMQYGNTLFLFIGDLSEWGFQYLTEQHSTEKLKTDVLCLGHTYVPLEFAQIIQPEFVISSCLNGVEGVANRAKQTFNQVGSKTFATCWNGIINVSSDGEKCSIVY